MPTKFEKERDARIAARKAEAAKKDEEIKKKNKALKDRLENDESQAITMAARVNMMKHGVIVEVVNTIQAKLAQEAGFTAISPYHYPSYNTSSTNMNPLTSDPRVIRDMMNAVMIPVIAKVRIGHIIEANMAKYLGANIIEECNYVNTRGATYMSKKGYGVPFMCGVSNLLDCFRRIDEGALMLRNVITGSNFSDTISTVKTIFKTLRDLKNDPDKRTLYASMLNNPNMVAMFNMAVEKGELPVPFFGYGWVTTPNDVALLRKWNCGAIISNIAFRADNPRRRLKMLVQASKSYDKVGEMLDLSVGTTERVYRRMLDGAQTENKF